MSIMFAGAASRGMVQLERSGHIEWSASGNATGSIHGKNTGPKFTCRYDFSYFSIVHINTTHPITEFPIQE